MKLQRLVEMIREDWKGAEQWPVLFTSYRQNLEGQWLEVDGAREPIVSVELHENQEEVLLIRDSNRPPFSVTGLEQALARLASCHGEFMVDCSEGEIAVDEDTVRIDFPISGAGRSEKDCCYLLAYCVPMAK